MITRLLLIIAVFAGLLGGQLEARGICGAGQVCSGCCAPESEASCCEASEKPAAPVTAPTAGHTMDWKMAVQPLLVLLPNVRVFDADAHSAFPQLAPRATGLARCERTCVRLI